MIVPLLALKEVLYELVPTLSPYARLEGVSEWDPFYAH